MQVNDRIIRKPELRGITGLSASTVIRMERVGRFPQRVALSPMAVGWRFSDVQTWIATREKIQPDENMGL